MKRAVRTNSGSQAGRSVPRSMQADKMSATKRFSVNICWKRTRRDDKSCSGGWHGQLPKALPAGTGPSWPPTAELAARRRQTALARATLNSCSLLKPYPLATGRSSSTSKGPSTLPPRNSQRSAALPTRNQFVALTQKDSRSPHARRCQEVSHTHATPHPLEDTAPCPPRNKRQHATVVLPPSRLWESERKPGKARENQAAIHFLRPSRKHRVGTAYYRLLHTRGVLQRQKQRHALAACRQHAPRSEAGEHSLPSHTLMPGAAGAAATPLATAASLGPYPLLPGPKHVCQHPLTPLVFAEPAKQRCTRRATPSACARPQGAAPASEEVPRPSLGGSVHAATAQCAHPSVSAGRGPSGRGRRGARSGAARAVGGGLVRGAAARHEVKRVVAAVVGADGRGGRGRARERVRLRGTSRVYDFQHRYHTVKPRPAQPQGAPSAPLAPAHDSGGNKLLLLAHVETSHWRLEAIQVHSACSTPKVCYANPLMQTRRS